MSAVDPPVPLGALGLPTVECDGCNGTGHGTVDVEAELELPVFGRVRGYTKAIIHCPKCKGRGTVSA